jgi:hypothetical protein
MGNLQLANRTIEVFANCLLPIAYCLLNHVGTL